MCARVTQMVSIGMGKGVGAAMGYQLPSFLVWAIKVGILALCHGRLMERKTPR